MQQYFSSAIQSKKIVQLKQLLFILELFDVGLKTNYLLRPNQRFFNAEYFFSRQVLVYSETQSSASVGKYWIFGVYFLFKMFDFYYNQSSHEQISHSQVKVLPKPFKENLREPEICPLCKGTLNQPSYISTSNKVYCFSCITSFLKEKGVCPETRIKSDEHAVKKIYD